MPPESLEKTAYEMLRSRIVYGDYMPGVMLSENEIAAAFGMSRTPVRAAISLLERDGFVESFKGRGVLVKEISFRKFCEIYEVLVSMQTFVLDLADKGEREFDLPALKSCLDQQLAAREADDYAGYYESALDFIGIMLRSSGNAFMMQVLDLCRGKFICRMVTFRKQHPTPKPNWSGLTNEKVYEALTAGKIEEAKAAIMDNYDRTTRQLAYSGMI
ncbi:MULTISPECIES: GntR family transcriptional regulator [unclassified Paenibacillus]|uniref:GntR family transcriptional regulator n=1 Tax=unclassified Paenibacillus TaxID=185978 RepID=UPI0009550BCB|nr:MULTISPECIES: GntR family transcriptional regulator [unclassified Paenibacillus]ASS66091.1 GntR family transcriptional regulator [Paenibacillus sp. RUD330]SIQ12823.1 DNA-binding transcriptional regulator, GntR family [Paenibacillus sp. RU4X]SIQ34597.1 DNA-binding transcriptional regulator, GntR family [Paenibacillus sp. RU4T]